MPKLKNIKVLIIDDDKEVFYKYSSWSLAVEGFNFLLREIIENHFSARHIYMLTGDLIIREYHHYIKPKSYKNENYV